MQLRLSLKELARRTGDWLARSPRLVVSGLIVVMVVLGLLIARNSQAQAEARSRAQAEGDSLLAVLQLRTTLLDLETGQRGYILTQNPAYLEPYTAARRRVTDEFEGVRRALLGMTSTADEAQLRKFGDLLGSKLAELDRTVALGKAGEFSTAATIVQSSLGKQDMDAMHAQMAALSRSQAERRDESFAQAREIDRNFVPLILALWLAVMLFGWAAVVGERRRAATQARAQQAEELRAAHDRAKLLAAELDHRVKNLFTVVLAIIQLSQSSGISPAETLTKIVARIRALMLAHNAALSGGGVNARLRDVAERVLAPYSDDAASRVRISGPDVQLGEESVTPIALILHELATNAAKYGALSRPEGALVVEWSVDLGQAGEQRVTVSWRENGGPALGDGVRREGSGFGTQMTNAAAEQLGGTLVREWPAEGAVVTLSFPQV